MPSPYLPDFIAGGLSQLLKRPRIAMCSLLLVLALVLHRPILHLVTERLIEHIAAKHGLSFSGAISGNVLSEIQFAHVRLKATPASKSSIDFVRLKKAHITYNLLSALRNGLKGSIHEVSADGVRLCMHSLESKETNASSHSPQIMSDILALPLLAPESIALSNVDIELSQNGACLLWLREGYLIARPESAGLLRIGQLHFRDHPPVFGLETRTSYRNRKLCLDSLVLTPELELSKFEFGESLENKRRAEVIFEIRDKTGHIGGAFHAHTRSDEWTGHLESEQFSCRAVFNFLGLSGSNLPEDITGVLDIHGVPAQTNTWLGSLNWKFKQPISSCERALVEVEALISNGELLVQKMDFTAHASKASLSGKITLPATFIGSEACIGTLSLRARCTDLSEWQGLLLTNKLRGRAEINATLHLNRGNLQSDWNCDLNDLVESSWRSEAVHTEGTISTPTTGGFEIKRIGGNALLSIKKTSITTPEVRLNLTEAVSAVAIADGVLRLWNLQVKDGENLVTGELSYPLSNNTAEPQVDLSLQFPDLNASSVFSMTTH